MSIKIKFNAEKCVGCYACHIACLDAHHEVDEADAKSFRAIRKVQKEGFEKISVRAVPIAENVWKSVRYMPFTVMKRPD